MYPRSPRIFHEPITSRGRKQVRGLNPEVRRSNGRRGRRRWTALCSGGFCTIGNVPRPCPYLDTFWTRPAPTRPKTPQASQTPKRRKAPSSRGKRSLSHDLEEPGSDPKTGVLPLDDGPDKWILQGFREVFDIGCVPVRTHSARIVRPRTLEEPLLRGLRRRRKAHHQ